MAPFGRRTALRGAAVLAGSGLLTGAAAGVLDELRWDLDAGPMSGEVLRTRILSGIPASVAYGQPVTLGPVTVQLICSDQVSAGAWATGHNVLSAVFPVTVVVTDARGLSGRFGVDVTIPRTPVPVEEGDFVLTGTATLSGGNTPAARNPGPMTVAVEPAASGFVVLYSARTGEAEPLECWLRLQPGQDPLLATIEVH
ncbi:hypothetical protein Amsp01_097610 [Amycolatopsis sp. NBRC 101858]|uniref:DUF6801 domain-containing protein n=1 Tax=Amycolatopsis sp. NBRC 101858 TaxID=3032200 RepID=UPI00249FB0C8|nr:DUF6801 domain-containing protein [Amycolatopsis sp. NBRC 101858]GLY43738.1 hypothetical protein Amsp01_097610 [Amycolatopsis sp. NBRC 101858]